MKSPLQTAFEKLADEELAFLRGFIADRRATPAACMEILGWHLDFVAQSRGTLPKAKGINLIEQPEKGLAAIIKGIRADQAARAHLVKGTIHAMDNLDDEAFMQTARAHCGVNDLFGDEAIRAAQDLDEGFFKSALEAVRTLKAKSRRAKPKGGESKLLLHIQTALTFLHEGDAKGQLPQRKVTKKKLREVLETRLGGKVFGSKSDSWPVFFTRPEIAPFVTQERAGGRPKTSGKGRGVESFEVNE